jgi:hypothetical protein
MSTFFDNLKTSEISLLKEKEVKMAKIMKKWEATKLLKGLDGTRKVNVAQLLENQANQLLSEATTMSNGDIEGYAAVAFPLVRRVFGDLIAEKLVSVQPMSLPVGLIFFLDFVYANGTNSNRQGLFNSGESIYGGNKVGSGITEGLDIETGSKGFYDLNQGYSSPYDTLTISEGQDSTPANDTICNMPWTDSTAINTALTAAQIITAEATHDVKNDPRVLYDNGVYVYRRYCIQLTAAEWTRLNLKSTINMNTVAHSAVAGDEVFDWALVSIVNRLTTLDEPNYRIYVVLRATVANAAALITTATDAADFMDFNYAINDKWTNGSSIGALAAEDWYHEGPTDKDTKYLAGNSTYAWQEMGEIDIKLNNIPISANTRKLKAKYTPEVQQDLNVFHNVDAETELTGIMSEHMNLEINQEILGDLVNGATAGKFYWSRIPGNFVNRETGIVSTGDFTGTVSEWYETLCERINDLSSVIHRKTLKGGANFIVCNPDVASILEMTNGFRASVEVDDNGDAGVYKSGNMNKKWDVYVDPYFPIQVMLVGRVGKQFLESGYVYAPYVPIQFTPTIYGPEDFVPRKGASTRYGKKMVRPDLYGLIEIKDIHG